MNDPNSTPNERHYGEHAVILTNARGDVLHGLRYVLYPVDEPPLIEVPSVDRRWYREVWERGGWQISTPDREPQPSDGPDFHAEHAAWSYRNAPERHGEDADDYSMCICGRPMDGH